MKEFLKCSEAILWKCNRIKTYTHWPFINNAKCCAEKMAEAGFVAIGGENEPDLVECFVCGKQLYGWDPDDDPWTEHITHNPLCEFVKVNKFDEMMWTLKEYFTLIKENKRINFKKIIDEAVITAKQKDIEILDEIKQKFQVNNNAA